MNVVILFWTRDTATPKLDRHLGAAEKHALPFLMTNATRWLYCVPFYFMGQRAGLLNWQDGLAIVVYVLGTVIHFTADLQKKRFKAKPEMKGLGSTRVSGATAPPELFQRPARLRWLGSVRRESLGVAVACDKPRAICVRRHTEE